MAEFELSAGGVPVPWGATVATNPDGNGVAARLIDGELGLKWIDGSWPNGSTTGVSTLVLDAGAGAELAFDGYRYATGGDVPGRDPVSWTLAVSDDGVAWTEVASVAQATITDLRQTWTQMFAVSS